MTDLRTDREKAKAARDHAICNEYRQLRAEQPSTSKHRLHCYIASKYGVTYPTIAKILTEKGINY